MEEYLEATSYQCNKGFLRRAGSDILPTKSNIAKRGVVKEETCMLCCSERETVAHILWSCLLAHDAWSVSGRNFQKSLCEAMNFIDIIDYLFQHCSREDMDLFATTTRNIWNRHIFFLHGGPFHHPNYVAKEAALSVQQYWNVALTRENESRPTGEMAQVHWTPPPQNLFKENWDIAQCKEKQRIGIGIIIRDFKGLVCAALSQTIEIYTEVATAEAMGALRVIEFCKDIGIQEVIFEGDAEVVVKAINKHDSTLC
ncbi:uncharacterized protein LOC132181948 [Corylus avellana]|uniref:uncharacterized protein LOC132181948 n=1 Tax=Corylus avellana TaxID=13451 RepID=UPI00286A79EB|nr:uncharacterized protein LOC132181948 [Corylus avellana]